MFDWRHVGGLSQREAASRFGIARETVKKMPRHSEPPGYRRHLCLVKTWSSRLVARWSRTGVGDLVPDSSGDPWSPLEIVRQHVKWNAAMGLSTNVSNSCAVSSDMRDRSQGQAYLQAPTMPLGSCLPSRGVSIAHPGLG